MGGPNSRKPALVYICPGRIVNHPVYKLTSLVYDIGNVRLRVTLNTFFTWKDWNGYTYLTKIGNISQFPKRLYQ